MKNKKNSKENLANNFYNPSSEYGPTPCWWWEAGQIEKDKLEWQIKEMKEKGISGTVMFNRYFAGDRYSSNPPYFSEKWWELVKFVAEEGKKLGMKFWFSDWTGRQYWQNLMREELDENRELGGHRLAIHETESKNSNTTLEIEIPCNEEVLDIAAYKKVGRGLDYGSRVDLNSALSKNKITWQAAELEWLLVVVVSQPHDLDYLDGKCAKRWIELHWSKFEEKLPELLGDTIIGYIQDELYVLSGNILYSKSILNRCKAQKNYDIASYLVGLFYDIGDMTDKIRCEYYDMMITLLEDNLYGTLSKWHEEHKLMYGTDATWGRLDIVGQTFHYGDFFRMMRWFHMTGNEDPHYSEVGERCFIDDKLSSSIAHLYGRKRVMVDVYWQSGWGVTQEQNLAWTNENYAYGMNMYNRHGILYTTMGGWYEWVPPAVHFRQPYWQHWKTFADYIKRLSYIMSQGKHQADVAILYPITTIHANWSRGDHFDAVADFTARTTFSLAKLIYKYNLDFDFIDYFSLSKAEISDGKLKVSGLEFRALLLPPMSTIRTATLEKIKEFYDQGGTVVSFHTLPSSSAEKGRDDPYIRSLIKDIFGLESSKKQDVKCLLSEERTGYSVHKKENEQGGKSFFIPGDEALVPKVISTAITQDVEVFKGKDIYHLHQNKPMTSASVSNTKTGMGIFHTHQKIDNHDVYFLFNSRPEERDLEFTFRVYGQPELWDAFTGQIKPVYRFELLDGKTRVRLNMQRYQGLILVFSSFNGGPQVVGDNLSIIDRMQLGKKGLKVEGFYETGGKKKIILKHEDKEYISEVRVSEPPEPITLTGKWNFNLDPTMDNKWGDFHYSPSLKVIGPEARRFKYKEEEEENGTKLNWQSGDCDDSIWPEFTYTFGPYWWSAGPFEEGKEPKSLVEHIEKNGLASNRNKFKWQPYCFSQKFGHEDTKVHNANEEDSSPGLQGVSEDFVVFPEMEQNVNVVRYLFTYVVSPEEEERLLNFGGKVNLPRQAYVNGRKVISTGSGESEAVARVHLGKGINTVLLKLTQIKGKRVWTYIDLQDPDKDISKEEPLIPLLKWFRDTAELRYDITPEKENPVGWYRFEAPPGLKSMKLELEARSCTAWINGEEVKVNNGEVILDKPLKGVSKVALRVEQEPGYYAGAAFKEPVAFRCEKTTMPLGNWEDYALETYSGGAKYEKNVKLNAEHLSGKIFIDLGLVMVSAELIINGKSAGVKLARPYRFDITELVRERNNKIEVKVFNTLANHYNIGYPTKFVYENQTISGMLGPVKLQFLSKIELEPVLTSKEERL